MGKFVVPTLLLLCALQAFAVGHRDGGEPRDFIDDVIAMIKESLAKMLEQVKAMVQAIKERIEEALNKIDIDKTVEEITERIVAQLKQMLDEAGIDPSKVEDCMNAAAGRLTSLALETKEGIAKCRDTLVASGAEVEKQLQELVSKAAAVNDDVVKRIGDCVEGNKGHPAAVLTCLKNEQQAIVGEIQDLAKQVRDVGGTATKVIVDGERDMIGCAEQVAENAGEKSKVIVTEFDSCIHRSN